MRFEFNDLHELQGFLEWAGYARAAPGANVCMDGGTFAGVVEPLPEIEPPAETSGGGDQPDAPAPVEQKRKRRTKAEMEAARAAEQSGNSVAGEAQTDDASTKSPENASEAAEATNPFAQTADDVKAADPAESAGTLMEAADFIKSRLVERPEVSQIEHLNMARTFIGKHGMDKYNQSFALASLSNNVMGYSPADCATHAAALDFLSLE